MALSRAACLDIAGELICRKEPIELSGRQLKQLQGSYVYQFLRTGLGRNSESLYIGVKTGGESRPLDPDHHRLGRGTEILDDDTLMIYPMPNGEVAKWVEGWLIREYPTAWNRQTPWVEAPPDAESPTAPLALPGLGIEDYVY